MLQNRPYRIVSSTTPRSQSPVASVVYYKSPDLKKSVLPKTAATSTVTHLHYSQHSPSTYEYYSTHKPLSPIVNQNHLKTSTIQYHQTPQMVVHPVSPFAVQNINPDYQMCTPKSHAREEQLRCELMREQEEKHQILRRLSERDELLRRKDEQIALLQRSLHEMQRNLAQQQDVIKRLPQLINKSIQTNIDRLLKNSSVLQGPAVVSPLNHSETSAHSLVLAQKSMREVTTPSFSKKSNADSDKPYSIIQELAAEALREMEEHLLAQPLLL